MPDPGYALPGMCPAACPSAPGLLMGVISSEPLEEKGCSYTLINNQPKLFGPVSMGTAAWLRLIFSVVNVDNKSNEDAAEQTSNLCLRGWVHHVGAVSLPVAVAYVKGRSGAGEGSLAARSEDVFPKPQEGQHRHKWWKGHHVKDAMNRQQWQKVTGERSYSAADAVLWSLSQLIWTKRLQALS